jgi:hypothetical protein
VCVFPCETTRNSFLCVGCEGNDFVARGGKRGKTEKPKTSGIKEKTVKQKRGLAGSEFPAFDQRPAAF